MTWCDRATPARRSRGRSIMWNSRKSIVTACALAIGVAVRAMAAAGEPVASRFPNVALRTQDNRAVRFYDDIVKDRLVIISFMFTSCTSQCPRSTANLAKVQDALGDRLGRDVFMASISVDPERDTP